MYFSCNQKVLASKISIVSKAINHKITLDVLKCFLIEAKEDKVTITGYDLETGIVAELQANVMCEGSILIQASLFSDIINKLPDDIVEVESKDNKLNLKCKDISMDLVLNNDSDYPRFDILEDEPFMDISGLNIKQMIKTTNFAISQDKSKAILGGQLLTITRDTIELAALDGYRAAIAKLEIDDDESEEIIKLIIPGKFLKILQNSVRDDQDVSIIYDDKYIMFRIDDIVLISRLLLGDFIDYKKLLPKDCYVTVNVDKADLISAAERASLVSINEKNNLITFDINTSNNEMIISSSCATGRIEEKIKMEATGDNLVIHFNSRYILEVIKNISFDNLILKFTTPVHPFVLTNRENDYIHLLLPVRKSIT